MSNTEAPPAADGLAGLLRGPAPAVAPDLPVGAALRHMLALRVGAVVVADPLSRFPLGILTHRDVIERVTLVGGSLDEAVAAVMTGGVVSLPLSATPHQARLALARGDIRHLVVVDSDGCLAGMVTRSDLYSLGLLAADDMMESIQSAADEAELAAAAARIRATAVSLVEQGVGAERIGEWVAIVNDLLTLSALAIAEDTCELPPVRWCWLAFGSEGRLEQTLVTDQDNGLIFEAADAAEAEALRARFLPFAARVNTLLAACGFELCAGGIMAGNPQCCLSAEEWRHRFGEWIGSGSPEGLLNATIFFDFRPLSGDFTLAAKLRAWLLGRTAHSPMFLRFMAVGALQVAPPLGRFRAFAVDRKSGLLDLKRDGSRLFVDAARIYALALGLAETSTASRLRAVGRRLNWSCQEVEALLASFHFIQQLRFVRQRAGSGLPAGANLVAPQDLNEVERAVLKASFLQARAFQARLQLRYQL